MTITTLIALSIGLAAVLAGAAGTVRHRRTGSAPGEPRAAARRRLTSLSLVVAGVAVLAAVALAAGLHGQAQDGSAASRVAGAYGSTAAADGLDEDTDGSLTAPAVSPSAGTSSSGFGSGGS